MLPRRLQAFEHTVVCTDEIAGMMKCFEAHSWDTSACTAQIEEMEACSKLHARDPDPRVLARQWQGAVRNKVIQFFAKKSLGSRLR